MPPLIESLRRWQLRHRTGLRVVAIGAALLYALYLLAARQGDVEAIDRLIKVYDQGELEQAADPAQAALWREKRMLAKTP